MKKHIGMEKSVKAVSLGKDLETALSSLTQLHESRVASDYISEFLGSRSFIDQIKALKKIGETIKGITDSTQYDAAIAVRFLITLYLTPSLCKSALHKAITSLMPVCDEVYEKLSSFGITTEQLIVDHLQQLTSTKDFITCIRCLIESSPSSCRYKAIYHNLSIFIVSVADHLDNVLSDIRNARTEKVNSTAHSANISVGHLTCQTLFRLISLSSMAVARDIQQCLQSSLQYLQQTLHLEEGSMDLLISVGLCIAQILYIQSISLQVDQGVYYTSEALILINSASLDSTESNIDIIESTCQAMSEPVIPASTCRHMYLCCLLNGLVSCSKQHGLQFHQLIFKTVCQLTQQKMYINAQLVFIKMLVTWTACLRREMSEYKEFMEAVYSSLFNYLLFVWEHSTEVVRQSSREVYANLLAALKTSDQLRTQSLTTIMSYPWSRKGKYGFLMEYVNKRGVEDVLAHIDGNRSVISLLHKVICYIHQQQLANYISEFICCMMSADKKSNSYTCQEWIQRWLIPLVDAMKCQPDCHKNVSQNLLPKITKIWPETIVELLNWLSTDGVCEGPTVDIYLMLARRARTGGLLKEHLQQGDTWCGVLSQRLLHSALHSNNSERRLAAFALICESHKTTTPIADFEFTWVNEFIRDNSYHEEPSFRQQMLSHLKHFLYHVSEWTRKLSHGERQPATNFLRVLGTKQIQRLDSSSIANHRSVALDILTLISQIFPYGTFSDEPK
ncbi:THADA [Bugula neritina]|uniref:THADA n=1 Tax=Bugula neritina TaxID=10212 RepID=A0A7J7J1P1_BUGNE|nr:THADA [Bugula neritina]